MDNSNNNNTQLLCAHNVAANKVFAFSHFLVGCFCFFVAPDIVVAVVGSCCRPVNIAVVFEFISSDVSFHRSAVDNKNTADKCRCSNIWHLATGHMCVHCKPANSGIHIRFWHTPFHPDAVSVRPLGFTMRSIVTADMWPSVQRYIRLCAHTMQQRTYIVPDMSHNKSIRCCNTYMHSHTGLPSTSTLSCVSLLMSVALPSLLQLVGIHFVALWQQSIFSHYSICVLFIVASSEFSNRNTHFLKDLHKTQMWHGCFGHFCSERSYTCLLFALATFTSFLTPELITASVISMQHIQCFISV